MTKTNTKQVELLKSFVRWCAKANFIKENEGYISPTQLIERVCGKARETIKKYKSMEEK